MPVILELKILFFSKCTCAVSSCVATLMFAVLVLLLVVVAASAATGQR